MKQIASWDVDNPSATREIPRLLRKPVKIHCHVYRNLRVAAILCITKPAYLLTLCFFNARFNIIIPSTQNFQHPPIKILQKTVLSSRIGDVTLLMAIAWYDIWCDVVWYDVIWWYDIYMIWYMIWYDMIYIYMIWYMIYDDIICYDMIWYDMIWYDMIWYDMIWYDMIWYTAKCMVFQYTSFIFEILYLRNISVYFAPSSVRITSRTCI